MALNIKKDIGIIMKNTRVQNREFTELARLAASEIIFETEAGFQGFKNLKKRMKLFNFNQYDGRVNTHKCFEFCKSTFYYRGLEGLEKLLHENIKLEDVDETLALDRPADKLVNGLVPDSWLVMSIPEKGTTPKTYRLIASWFETDKFFVTKGLLSNQGVEEHPAYYIWKEPSKTPILLLKDSDLILSDSAEKTFHNDFVDPINEHYHEFSVYLPENFQAFLNPECSD